MTGVVLAIVFGKRKDQLHQWESVTGQLWVGIALGLGLEWNVAGVAWATVIGESIVAIGALVWLWRGFDRRHAPSRARILDRPSFLALIVLNRDIMIRSFALVASFALFTRIGAQFDARGAHRIADPREQRIRDRLDEILASHTGQDKEKIRKDTDRDNILTADQAKEYGIVDEVFEYRKKSMKK